MNPLPGHCAGCGLRVYLVHNVWHNNPEGTWPHRCVA